MSRNLPHRSHHHSWGRAGYERFSGPPPHHELSVTVAAAL